VIASHPLDNPARAALLSTQMHLAERRGQVLRYPADISPFIALPDDPGPSDWDDLAGLVGPGGVAATAGVPASPPPGWQVLMNLAGVQLTGEHVKNQPATGEAASDAAPLGPADVPEMLDLVARTRPGPFLPRTIELGGYVGIRRNGALVAMAGERVRPSGWSEISAVCTDADFRGEGLASQLTLAVVSAITRRGEMPFLHASADNVSAIRLYESLGFQFRRPATFVVMRAPGASWTG
jgi:ribosomal protein S18 acetylase RimI-like enzyme